ncbi:hypothetical protein BDF21DRAFT_381973 [Thamnidium elegans]|nr:hypothetical protein BDF21DRAFT_381973 [Thamnidium elegans]
MKEDKKHLVIFIGYKGTGVGSTIKGYRWYNETWKQKIHGQSTTCITNENKTSQTCVYCFRPLSHSKQKAIVKGEMIQKSINDAFICYNQTCVSVCNNRNVQIRDSVSGKV